MNVTMLPYKLASTLYYSAWPLIKPQGYLGRLVSASRQRQGREWETASQVWARQKLKINTFHMAATC